MLPFDNPTIDMLKTLPLGCLYSLQRVELKAKNMGSSGELLRKCCELDENIMRTRKIQQSLASPKRNKIWARLGSCHLPSSGLQECMEPSFGHMFMSKVFLVDHLRTCVTKRFTKRSCPMYIGTSALGTLVQKVTIR